MRSRGGAPGPAEPRAEPVPAAAVKRTVAVRFASLALRTHPAERGDALFGRGVAHAAAVQRVLDVERETGAGPAIWMPGDVRAGAVRTGAGRGDGRCG